MPARIQSIKPPKHVMVGYPTQSGNHPYDTTLDSRYPGKLSSMRTWFGPGLHRNGHQHFHGFTLPWSVTCLLSSRFSCHLLMRLLFQFVPLPSIICRNATWLDRRDGRGMKGIQLFVFVMKFPQKTYRMQVFSHDMIRHIPVNLMYISATVLGNLKFCSGSWLLLWCGKTGSLMSYLAPLARVE